MTQPTQSRSYWSLARLTQCGRIETSFSTVIWVEAWLTGLHPSQNSWLYGPHLPDKAKKRLLVQTRPFKTTQVGEITLDP